jgi:uncharacterized protein YuzE
MTGTDEPIHLGFLSLPAEIQDACTAEPEPSGRTRIEIVADELGRAVEVDYEADMAFFTLHPIGPGEVDRTWEVNDGVLADFDASGRLVGVEVFLVHGCVLAEDLVELKQLLPV